MKNSKMKEYLEQLFLFKHNLKGDICRDKMKKLKQQIFLEQLKEFSDLFEAIKNKQDKKS